MLALVSAVLSEHGHEHDDGNMIFDEVRKHALYACSTAGDEFSAERDVYPTGPVTRHDIWTDCNTLKSPARPCATPSNCQRST